MGGNHVGQMTLSPALLSPAAQILVCIQDGILPLSGYEVEVLLFFVIRIQIGSVGRDIAAERGMLCGKEHHEKFYHIRSEAGGDVC